MIFVAHALRTYACHLSDKGASEYADRSCNEAIMLNPTSLLADALGRNLADTYRRIYGDQEPRMGHALDEAARLVIERIASSDALYHNCEHTALVTLCVQDILRGRRRTGGHAKRLGPYHLGRAQPRHRICAWHLRR
jgi:hypothetical protein